MKTLFVVALLFAGLSARAELSTVRQVAFAQIRAIKRSVGVLTAANQRVKELRGLFKSSKIQEIKNEVCSNAAEINAEARVLETIAELGEIKDEFTVKDIHLLNESTRAVAGGFCGRVIGENTQFVIDQGNFDEMNEIARSIEQYNRDVEIQLLMRP